MATNNSSQCVHYWGLFFLSLLSLYYVVQSTPTPHRVYIVYLGRKCHDDPKLTSNHHLRLLSNVFASEEEAKKSILYSYEKSFSGFSAILNSSQATILAERKEVISVFESKILKPHTTRSWDFLGLSLTKSSVGQPTPPQLAYGHDTIVGVIDSGIWPESPSFKEEAKMKPIPSRWRGECEKGERFNPQKDCNRKLIGARYYFKGFEADFKTLIAAPEIKSARDFTGHGTHTASTAAGAIVGGASFSGGLAKGTARGGAPRARLAVYKACWGGSGEGEQQFNFRCSEADLLKAFDDALWDGVHVISVSLGSVPPLRDLFESGTAIGSFHAMQVGVSVVFSAGNEGPETGLVTNVQPWSISVAASTVDRSFPTRVVVEGNFSVLGESFSFINEPITGKLVNPLGLFKRGICNVDQRDVSKKTKAGKIIFCFSTIGFISIEDAIEAAKNISASALIFIEPSPKPEGPDFFPTVRLDLIQGIKLKDYQFQFDNLPLAKIGPTKTLIGKTLAPRVAYFSSRGPSSLEPDILKPDLTAPGMNILGAWPTETAPSYKIDDKRSVKWNFQSGTSMSCPHVSGIVALLRSAHPNWSPAAIKSALMTTASTRDNSDDNIFNEGILEPSDPFDIGAGHVEPLKALDPGLVYDMNTNDYILFLCNIGYTTQQILKLLIPCPITPDIVLRCPRQRKSNSNINYPSISISNLSCATTIQRKVRNVGLSKFVVYFSNVVEPNGVEVVVWPRVLFFSYFKEEVTYYVTLTPRKKSRGRYDFGEIVWSDGFHKVRSPLVVSVNTISISSTIDHESDDQMIVMSDV
ncbi:subtilisin-like protease SBT3.18 [Humulus lupulus]|uniref:subtilisin-like protease SBT3.18 n=1 Tax=Humulus lupulus TaxID=3486 RepID=UPI002B40A19B|nr:subtilisin-like protease SBT3.18 [Humulus lupulus]